MPLQNRVDPEGNIISTNARGAWLGNRGVIHNDQKQIVRPFKIKAWITCALQFKGRHRAVMTPNRWTELFFLDEATAFAAGHRPCFECRRDYANLFKAAWIKGNPGFGFNLKTPIGKIDDIIHSERIKADRSKVIFKENPQKLPDGTFILFENNRYLINQHKMYLWTPFGYEAGKDLPANDKVEVLTPASIVNAFAAGYIPQMGLKV
ncbi:MAG TPA: hypothetical protein VIM55_17925 [Mucilaginibacter sp.]